MIEYSRLDRFTMWLKALFTKNLKRIVKLLLALMGSKKYRDKLMRKLRREPPVISPAVEHWNKRLNLFTEFYDNFFGPQIQSTYAAALKSPASRWNEYHRVIAGSDQVWNLNIIRTFEALRFYYLEFADKSKQVNYAPSFGVSELTKRERDVHRKGLQGFSRLSCREKEGCGIIKELTGREAELVLDPTLLLNAEDWRKISRKPKYEVPEHYVLTYLWSIERYARIIEEFADNRQVIHLFNPTDESFSMTGPREFLWLVDHADLVLSESFHGNAFAVNFGKNFVSFGKGSGWFSRIRTLLSSLDLMDRIYDPDKPFVDVPVDYEAVSKKLDALRVSSMRYLRECLKV